MNEDNKILLLEQEFKNHKELTEKQIKELNKKIEMQQQEIIELKMQNTKTDVQYEQIMQILNKLNEKTIPDLINQIEELKNKPAKRYDQAIGSILGAIFGAIGGAIAGIFLK